MRSSDIDVELNVLEAEGIWGPLPHSAVIRLRELIKRYRLSVAGGDLQHLENGWYVTHSGLLGLAYRHHCAGINVQQIREFCDAMAAAAGCSRQRSTRSGMLKDSSATETPTPQTSLLWSAAPRCAWRKPEPSIVPYEKPTESASALSRNWAGSPNRRSRLPQTIRAVLTLLRCKQLTCRNRSNGSNGNPSRLRDKLCLLIRQYNLDPTLVKEYAAHFCGTETIKDASRDLVESFIAHLSSSAKEDIDGLICKLNSFSRPSEVKQ